MSQKIAYSGDIVSRSHLYDAILKKWTTVCCPLKLDSLEKDELDRVRAETLSKVEGYLISCVELLAGVSGVTVEYSGEQETDDTKQYKAKVLIFSSRKAYKEKSQALLDLLNVVLEEFLLVSSSKDIFSDFLANLPSFCAEIVSQAISESSLSRFKFNSDDLLRFKSE